MTERQFIGLGLPLRPYYRHGTCCLYFLRPCRIWRLIVAVFPLSVLQAPGLYQGYAPETLPGITQAISNGNERVAQSESQLTAYFITKAANFLLSGSAEVRAKLN